MAVSSSPNPAALTCGGIFREIVLGTETLINQVAHFLKEEINRGIALIDHGFKRSLDFLCEIQSAQALTPVGRVLPQTAPGSCSSRKKSEWHICGMSQKPSVKPRGSALGSASVPGLEVLW